MTTMKRQSLFARKSILTKNRMLLQIRLYRNGKVVGHLSVDRGKWRRAYGKLASAHADRYYVRVDYGMDKTNFEHTVVYSDGSTTRPTEMFYNEYDGTSKQDAQQALKAFME